MARGIAQAVTWRGHILQTCRMIAAAATRLPCFKFIPLRSTGSSSHDSEYGLRVKKIAMSSEDVPLVPSEGVGSGGKDHSTKHLMFRLPPPIPGKPGGGYPVEYHAAATTIQRNVQIFWKRKRQQGMKEVALDGSDQAKPSVVGERTRKRDLLLNYVKGVAGAVTNTISKSVSPAGAVFNQLSLERQKNYQGWLFETVKTSKAVAFFIARRDKESDNLHPFDQTRKQPKVPSLSFRTFLFISDMFKFAI